MVPSSLCREHGASEVPMVVSALPAGGMDCLSPPANPLGSPKVFPGWIPTPSLWCGVGDVKDRYLLSSGIIISLFK